MEHRMTVREILEEIEKRVAAAIEAQDREAARTIYETEYRPALEAADNLWEAR